MSTADKPRIRDKYDVHTEACPKMTRRWKRDRMPEVAAWLLVFRVRIERQRLHCQQAIQSGGGEELRAALTKLTMRVSVLDDLIRSLPDKWSDYLWWECAALVEDTLSPVPEKPVHTPSIPGTESPICELPSVTDGTTRRGRAGTDSAAGTGVNPKRPR